MKTRKKKIMKELEAAWKQHKQAVPRWDGVSKLKSKSHKSGVKAERRAKYIPGMNIAVEKKPLPFMDAQMRCHSGGPVYYLDTGRSNMLRDVTSSTHLKITPKPKGLRKGSKRLKAWIHKPASRKNRDEGTTVDDMMRRDREIARSALSARRRQAALAKASYRMPMCKLDRKDSLSRTLIG